MKQTEMASEQVSNVWGQNSQVREACAGGREEKAGWKLLGMDYIYCVGMKNFVLAFLFMMLS